MLSTCPSYLQSLMYLLCEDRNLWLWRHRVAQISPSIGESNDTSLQYCCLENPLGGRSLVGCSPWGLKESDMTERLHFHFLLSCIGEGNGNPLQCSCLENPRDGGAWWAAIYGVAQSWTRLKRLSSSSSSSSGRGYGVLFSFSDGAQCRIPTNIRDVIASEPRATVTQKKGQWELWTSPGLMI